MALGENEPDAEPTVDHVPPVAIVTPALSGTLSIPKQTIRSEPALMVGSGVIVTATVLLAALHIPLPVVVRVSVALPFLICWAEGVKVAFNVLAFGENVPVPEAVVQVAPVAPVIVPLSIAEELAQIVCGAPALEVGAVVICTVILLVTAWQVP